MKWYEDLPTWAKFLIPASIALLFIFIWRPWEKEEEEQTPYVKAQTQTLYQPVAAGTSATPEPMPYRLGEGYAVPSGWSYYTPSGDETPSNIPPAQEEPEMVYVYGPTADIEMARSSGLTEYVQFIDVSALPSLEQIKAVQRGGVILGGPLAQGGFTAEEEELARRAGAEITRLGGQTRYDTLAEYREWYREQFGD